MKWTSILAIYGLLWVASAFILLPVGIRSHEDDHLERIPGQADSAPTNFRPGMLLLRATVVAAVLCALFVANYTYGWITVDDINVFGEPPEQASEPAIYRT
ncbi:MAG: DUF1467 family protein [Caenibius sp.]